MTRKFKTFLFWPLSTFIFARLGLDYILAKLKRQLLPCPLKCLQAITGFYTGFMHAIILSNVAFSKLEFSRILKHKFNNQNIPDNFPGKHTHFEPVTFKLMLPSFYVVIISFIH